MVSRNGQSATKSQSYGERLTDCKGGGGTRPECCLKSSRSSSEKSHFVGGSQGGRNAFCAESRQREIVNTALSPVRYCSVGEPAEGSFPKVPNTYTHSRVLLRGEQPFDMCFQLVDESVSVLLLPWRGRALACSLTHLLSQSPLLEESKRGQCRPPHKTTLVHLLAVQLVTKKCVSFQWDKKEKND